MEDEQQALDNRFGTMEGRVVELIVNSESRMRGELYKVLWVQVAGIVAILAELRFIPVG